MQGRVGPPRGVGRSGTWFARPVTAASEEGSNWDSVQWRLVRPRAVGTVRKIARIGAMSGASGIENEANLARSDCWVAQGEGWREGAPWAKVSAGEVPGFAPGTPSYAIQTQQVLGPMLGPAGYVIA